LTCPVGSSPGSTARPSDLRPDTTTARPADLVRFDRKSWSFVASTATSSDVTYRPGKVVAGTELLRAVADSCRRLIFAVAPMRRQPTRCRRHVLRGQAEHQQHGRTRPRAEIVGEQHLTRPLSSSIVNSARTARPPDLGMSELVGSRNRRLNGSTYGRICAAFEASTNSARPCISTARERGSAPAAA
jgi:hypothetical protein